MTIRIESEEQLKEVAAKLLHISVNLLHWTKLWEEHRGSEYLRAKKKWQKILDDYLKELGMTKSHQQNEINISINNENQNTQ